MGLASPLVLVVDDSGSARSAHRRLLEASGCRVIEAENGEQALPLVVSARPDLVLLDLLMPLGMDGFATLAALRAAVPEVRVVVVSVDVQPSSKEMARAGGAITFLEKPLSASDVGLVLTQIFGRRPSAALSPLAAEVAKPAFALTAKDLVSKRVVIGSAEERLVDVAGRMAARRAQHCVVLDQKHHQPLGVIRFLDVAARPSAGNRILADLVSDVMPVKVTAEESALAVAALLERNGLSEIIVESESGVFFGLITVESAFAWMLREHREAQGALEELLGERERLNEILEKKVEQRTNELKGALDAFRFASLSLSHDFRAPLRVIQGHAEMLAAGEAGELTPDGKFNAQAIKRAATKLELMAEEILDKAERAAAVTPAEVEAVDLNVILEDAMDFHRDLLQERKAMVTKRGQLAWVAGRYVPVLQIVANLLSNAVKFVPAPREPVIEVWSEIAPDHVNFCIKDNGTGVPESHRNRIFEPFARVADSERGGFGLGLAIARSAALYVGGAIRLVSDSENGSVFTVSFRKHVHAGAPVPDPRSPTPHPENSSPTG